VFCIIKLFVFYPQKRVKSSSTCFGWFEKTKKLEEMDESKAISPVVWLCLKKLKSFGKIKFF